MALCHSSTGIDEALKGHRNLLKCCMSRRDTHASDGARPYHPVLEFGELDERRLDAVFHRTNLMSDIHCGLFDNLPAHDFSLPKAPAPGLMLSTLTFIGS
jgi:hypothetical protein